VQLALLRYCSLLPPCPLAPFSLPVGHGDEGVAQPLQIPSLVQGVTLWRPPLEEVQRTIKLHCPLPVLLLLSPPIPRACAAYEAPASSPAWALKEVHLHSGSHSFPPPPSLTVPLHLASYNSYDPRHPEGVTVCPHARPPPSRCDCRVSQSREQGEQFREVLVLTISLLAHLVPLFSRTRQCPKHCSLPFPTPSSLAASGKSGSPGSPSSR
jgi:hypothetical protein